MFYPNINFGPLVLRTKIALKIVGGIFCEEQELFENGATPLNYQQTT
jgi:hypothetical protein